MNSKIRVGIVTPAFFYVPFWAACDKSWYADAGLDVEIIDVGGIDGVTRMLKTGELEIGIGSPEHVIHDVEAGGSLRMVGGNVNRLTHSLIAQPEIKQLSDLRGKVIGVSALSGGTSSLFMDILEKAAGLHYPNDYTMVEAGPVPPRHDKLMRREIDACMQTDPHNYLAEDAGLSNLGAVVDWIPYFQFNSINVDQNWAQSHCDELVRFLEVSIRASQWMFADRAGAVSLAVEKMGIKDDYASRAWDDHAHIGALPQDLHLNDKSIQTAIEMMRRDRSAKHAIAAVTPSEKYADTSYLQAAQRRAGVPEHLLD
ncbi:MAG: transporter substrate-binding protein [Polaromonas sp.]|nr:transporter substrate-binding protein [Polaromonas sp.]